MGVIRHVVTVPLSEFEEVDCRTARCAGFTQGWTRALLPEFEADRERIERIEASGLDYVKTIQDDGHWVYSFSPGQRCKSGWHRRRKPQSRELYLVKRDRREPAYRHKRASDWVEDHGETVARFVEQREKG